MIFIKVLGKNSGLPVKSTVGALNIRLNDTFPPAEQDLRRFLAARIVIIVSKVKGFVACHADSMGWTYSRCSCYTVMPSSRAPDNTGRQADRQSYSTFSQVLYTQTKAESFSQ